MSDIPPKVGYGTASGVSTLKRAFGCPECGHRMGVPTASSGQFKLYCPEHSCQYEVTRRDMTTEQRFYVKIARESDSHKTAKKRVRDWLESGEWDV